MMTKKSGTAISFPQFFVLVLMVCNLKSYSMNKTYDTPPKDEPVVDLLPIQDWFRKVSDPTFLCNQSPQEHKIGIDIIFYNTLKY